MFYRSKTPASTSEQSGKSDDIPVSYRGKQSDHGKVSNGSKDCNTDSDDYPKMVIVHGNTKSGIENVVLASAPFARPDSQPQHETNDW